MARSSSSSSNTTPQKHEVFISFRSEETRKTFTSHLNGALERVDIITYVDKNLERGDEIPTTLVRAIEEAKLSVIVFSKNYADSKWCLDELVKILERGRTKRQIIVPVFYGVDPSDVRNQRGSYAEAFAKHETNSEDKTKVREWRNALVEAANYSGWDCNDVNRTEFEIVEEITKDVLEKLDRANVSDLDRQIAKMEQLARLQDQFYHSIITVENLKNRNATIQRVRELKMERSIRLLRLTPDMLSYMNQNNDNDDDDYLFPSF
ncbi:TMV resistance protein N [Cajanus cajan]|uniref:TMV resistance protein N n=1 Tax=Cajanus cajan TaxID=3821 RepID=A0A151TG16_CAJCA|nr:TMV resistance protein N [Cajanus cajan]KYP65963.1 TMV resistance protein N [Cajanus cajan]